MDEKKARKNRALPTAPLLDTQSTAGALDLDDLIERLLEPRGLLKIRPVAITAIECEELCRQARELMLNQPNVLELDAPIKLVGDIHGQYTDLLRIFEAGGFPPQTNYLFLGDYVDRGPQSLECICLVLAYKIKYPANFFLIRGNHEISAISRMYGFYDECKRRFNSIKQWKAFCNVFNCMPFAAIVGKRVFCVHAGISPTMDSLEDINNIARPTDVPDTGLACDLLWADPDETGKLGWGENDRGVSFTFGTDILDGFLHKHDFDLLVRAHQVVENGYEFFGDRKCVTVFSAPNYCGEFDNAAAIMTVGEGLKLGFQIIKPLTGKEGKKSKWVYSGDIPTAEQAAQEDEC